MILTGIISDIFKTESFPSFQKRLFWLQEDNPRSGKPNVWALECHMNDVNILDKFKTGDLVNCNFVIYGRKVSKNGEEKVFNTIRCIKIEKLK